MSSLAAITFERPGPAGSIAQVLTYVVLAAGIIFPIRYQNGCGKIWPACIMDDTTGKRLGFMETRFQMFCQSTG